MPDGRRGSSTRTLASMRRTRRRQETDLKLEIRHNGEPFVVSSKRRLARAAAYIDRSSRLGGKFGRATAHAADLHPVERHGVDPADTCR